MRLTAFVGSWYNVIMYNLIDERILIRLKRNYSMNENTGFLIESRLESENGGSKWKHLMFGGLNNGLSVQQSG